MSIHYVGREPVFFIWWIVPNYQCLKNQGLIASTWSYILHTARTVFPIGGIFQNINDINLNTRVKFKPGEYMRMIFTQSAILLQVTRRRKSELRIPYLPRPPAAKLTTGNRPI